MSQALPCLANTFLTSNKEVETKGYDKKVDE